jgi:hypothetical protein
MRWPPRSTRAPRTGSSPTPATHTSNRPPDVSRSVSLCVWLARCGCCSKLCCNPGQDFIFMLERAVHSCSQFANWSRVPACGREQSANRRCHDARQRGAVVLQRLGGEAGRHGHAAPQRHKGERQRLFCRRFHLDEPDLLKQTRDGRGGFEVGLVCARYAIVLARRRPRCSSIG